MFKPKTAEEIRNMGYDEFRKYVFSVPREYEMRMKYPEVVRIHGRTVKECEECIDAEFDVRLLIWKMEMPEESEILEEIAPIRQECLEDRELFRNYPNIIIPFTGESYVFEEVREVYAQDAKRIINLRKRQVRRYIEKYAKKNGITKINYNELTNKIIAALNRTNATKNN